MRVSKRVRQWLMVLSATLLVAGTLSVVPIFDSLISASPASAADEPTSAITVGGFAVQMKMDRDQTSQTAAPLAPGDTFTYTMSFECSDTTQGSDCVGAALDISGFAFTNVFSQSQPLIFDAGPLAMTPGGTAPPVTMSPNGSGAWKFTADAGFNAGDSFEF